VTILVAVAGANHVVDCGLRTILGQDPEIRVVNPVSAFGVSPDVILYDVIGVEEDGGNELSRLTTQHVSAIVVLSRDLRPDLAARGLALGASGSVSIEATSVAILAAVHAAAEGTVQDPAPLGAEANLSPREVEALTGITKGHSNNEIADALGLSINSLKSYIRSAYRKVGVTTRSQAVAWCLLHGFEPPPPSEPHASTTHADPRPGDAGWVTSGRPSR
jgi:DNA-binding NarL/FixJ family response regulator